MNDILIRYIFKNEPKIKLFGKDFIKNNKDKMKMVIANKEMKIKEYYNINDTKKYKFLK